MALSLRVIEEAFTLFKKSIAPAVLDAESRNNGHLLLKQVQKNKGRVPETVGELVPALKEATTQIAGKLEWDVLPKKLTSDPNKSDSPHALPTGVRGQQGKEVDAAAAYKKLQEESKAKILVMIDSFSPPSRRGGIDMKVRDEVQAQLRAHLASEEQRKVDLSQVVPVIQGFINTKYREIERNIERM